MLELAQKAYIGHILKDFKMNGYSPDDAPISKTQCLKMSLKEKQETNSLCIDSWKLNVRIIL